jgi:hypothetical protein
LFKVKWRVFQYFKSPEVVFCLIFSLVFAFGVGISTYNFGSLARYKIPLFPYYFTALAVILYQWKVDPKTTTAGRW